LTQSRSAEHQVAPGGQCGVVRAAVDGPYRGSAPRIRRK